ncbi:MAG: redox-sensing transcriptional repressor Rex, partial [Gemmatimonadota bacterium]|nr:redox-sensing transcriptional repressor Rex [Gemmatimonadota bacterium]
FSYRDFTRRGFHIHAVFDSDPAKVGAVWGDLHVRPESELDSALRAEQMEIAIIAVPSEAAQGVVDRVVDAGVRAILNFAPMRLRVPPEVALRNVDMTVELEGLAYAIVAERTR